VSIGWTYVAISSAVNQVFGCERRLAVDWLLLHGSQLAWLLRASAVGPWRWVSLWLMASFRQPGAADAPCFASARHSLPSPPQSPSPSG
jgi:hypothetical protein